MQYKLVFVEENGLPHQISGLVRNDKRIDMQSTNSGASGYQISMSLRASAHTGVAIRIPYKLKFAQQ